MDAIEIIKNIRSVTKCSLRDAKTLYDRLQEEGALRVEGASSSKKTERRKIIDFKITPPFGGDKEDRYAVIHALCDDGTIWWMNVRDGGVWSKEPNIPPL